MIIQLKDFNRTITYWIAIIVTAWSVWRSIISFERYMLDLYPFVLRWDPLIVILMPYLIYELGGSIRRAFITTFALKIEDAGIIINHKYHQKKYFWTNISLIEIKKHKAFYGEEFQLILKDIDNEKIRKEHIDLMDISWNELGNELSKYCDIKYTNFDDEELRGQWKN